MFRRLCALAVAVASFSALSACRDDSYLTADEPVVTDTIVAYALTGSPDGLPNALNTVLQTSVRITGSANFDVAFDLTPSGQIQVIPAKLVVSSLAGAHSVGLYIPTESFESITSAPSVYYRPDTAITISAGQTFLMQSFQNSGATICYYLATPRVYAKVVIDSVNTATKAIYLRQTMDPNCGYRSFKPGYPTG